MNTHFYLSGAAVLMLSACMGSGTIGDENNPAFQDSETREMLQIAATLDDIQSDSVSLSGTDPDNLPNSNNVEYTGAIAVLEQRNTVIFNGVGTTPTRLTETRFGALGEVGLNVDFIGGTVNGTADNFYELENPATGDFGDTTANSIAGTLNITLARDPSNAFAYLGDIDGTLFKDLGGVVSLNNEAMSGGFLGDDADIFVGVTDNALPQPDPTSSTITDDVTAAIFAQRN